MAQSKIFYKTLIFKLNYKIIKNSKSETKNSHACVPLKESGEDFVYKYNLRWISQQAGNRDFLWKKLSIKLNI